MSKQFYIKQLSLLLVEFQVKNCSILNNSIQHKYAV